MKKLINLTEIREKQSTQIPTKLFKTTESKRRELLKLLLKGHMLSKREARRRTDLDNIGDAIMHLRKKYNIEKIMVKNESTKSRFAVYFIPAYVKNLDLILKSYETRTKKTN